MKLIYTDFLFFASSSLLLSELKTGNHAEHDFELWVADRQTREVQCAELESPACRLLVNTHPITTAIDTRKASFFFPPSRGNVKLGRACASGDNAASHESFRAARAGKGAGGEQQCLSLACRDGTRLNKSRTTRNTMSAAIAKATAPDNPS